MALHATYYGANGWLLEFDNLRLLVDPWLSGSLQFAPGAWFFRAELSHPWPVPEPLDLLLLTQGLPDHCHPPTLARLWALGFSDVTALAPGQRHSQRGLQILATAGAAVPQLENGYLLEHSAGSLYLEPHGFLAANLPAQPLDAVITPVVDLGLPLAGECATRACSPGRSGRRAAQLRRSSASARAAA